MHVEHYNLDGTSGHPVLSRIVRSCYFPLKMLYCALRLDRLLWSLRPGVFHSDYEVLDAYYGMMTERMERYGTAKTHPVVLELGPGNSFILPYNFIREGTNKVYLVDKYPRHRPTPAQRCFFCEELDFFRKKYGIEAPVGIDMNACMPRDEIISFIEGDILDLEIGEPLDFVFSISVLQHIPDLGRVLEKLFAMMRPGSLMYHVIDLKDKWHEYGAPFTFYRYGDRVWDRYLTNHSNYTNRLRFGEYRDIFERCGFEILHYVAWDSPMTERKIAPRFSGRDDLAVGLAHFFLRKP